ncbi:exosortase A [Niveibacterium sp.]|uniref:exosortase A n=1 Tax=Niveibacterium sp. TaxID=2017444 RepID=UPI0035B19F5A
MSTATMDAVKTSSSGALIISSGLAAFALVVGVFWPTAREMASIWWRSETFAHGLVVVPISLWLLWGMRDQLLRQSLRPAPIALIPLAVAGFAWLAGESASVAAVTHFALVAMVCAALWCVWGNALARTAVFPLAFLFFGVPFGEFLIPTLMNHTADFTVAALRLTGVPVFREGNSFVIPSGAWSVVEACSGIRYLIASVMVGVLFAWLNYRTLRRRLLFVLAATLVPLVANWLRAYLIVMLGHLSGNKIATGVDHLIYGWLFFGVVIVALFWVGSFWRESDAAESGVEQSTDRLATTPPASTRAIAVCCFGILAVLLVWRPLEAWLAATPGAAAYTLEAPHATAGWVMTNEPPVAGWQPTYVGERARLVRTYRHGDDVVTLFIAYYASQTPGHELVQWDNRFVTAEDKRWRYGGEQPDQFSNGYDLLRTQLLGEPDRLEVWSWLWLGDSVTSDPKRAKLALVADRFAHRPDDSAAVIVIARKGEGLPEARGLVERFVLAHQAEIERVLRATPRS